MNTETLYFALNVTGPVLVLLATGYLLFRAGLLDDAFVASGSKLVFNVALPALLFLSISQADFSQTASPELLGATLIATLVFFIALTILVHHTVQPKAARGVVIQGGFRANMGIIGLAYCDNLYGPEGLALAAVILGVVTLLFNVLSVFILNVYLPTKRSLMQHLAGIVTNPLIISILLALPLSYWQIPLPEFAVSTGNYFAQLTLPLALLCTGASLKFRSVGGDARNIVISTISKCLLYPLVITLSCYAFGVRGTSLGVVYLLCVSPTAAASYVMTKGVGGDARLAASIIVITTVFSLPVTIVGYGMLQLSGAL
ncbi:AEC family transporter [Alteromonas sp. H39]|uniref:AEC family transporter n=1 Tax=Alteromonas sp. H39 TaxID=3389876 RepID=UPI0039DF50DB